MRKSLIMKVLLLLSMLALTCGCSKDSAPVEQSNGQNDQARQEMANILNSNPAVSNLTWSPTETMVLYIQEGKPEMASFDEAYAWRVNEAQALLIGEVSPGFLGFKWSPNGEFFMISETPGEGVSNTIFRSESLAEAHRIKSLDVPVWSPDSKFLAYGFEQHDYGDSWGSLQVYRLDHSKGEYIWNTRNYLYKVEYWDEQGNIGYIEIDDQGKQIHKTTQNMRPSISGVHLGDTREMVKTVLGDDYKETPPGEATMNFPEPVYRWSFVKGYEVFIGQNTGKVWEIMATYPGAETNLGIRIGDSAARVFEIYRPKYIEPDSIHGGKLYGVFKVEGAAALSFRFDNETGVMRAEIKPDNKVISIDLTYPNIMDDDF